MSIYHGAGLLICPADDKCHLQYTLGGLADGPCFIYSNIYIYRIIKNISGEWTPPLPGGAVS